MSIEDIFDGCDNFCEPEATPCFNWSANGVGFGQFYFYMKDGKMMCSNEMMSKEFIKDLLCKMIDECELDCPRESVKE